MRIITKTCKVKLSVSEDGKEDIFETFRQYNFALNFCVNKAWEPERKIINKSKLHKITYYPLKEKTNLPANYICSARNKACNIVRGIIIRWSIGKKASKPTFKSFSAIQMDKRTLTIKDRSCTFSTINGRAKAKYLLGNYQRKILDDPNCEFRTATLTHKNNAFFLNITLVKPALVRTPKVVMGIDLGIKNLAVISTGKFFSAGPLNGIRREFREKRSNIQKKDTRSAHILLKRLGGSENRISNWILHNISRQIVNEALGRNIDVIAFEKLTGVRERVKRWRKAERAKINLWAFSELQQYVQYKALEAGIDTVFVEAKYTSQRCSKCGHIESSNRNGFNFKCKHCGYSINADYNASKNIAFKVLSGKSPDWTGRPSKLALKSGGFILTDKALL